MPMKKYKPEQIVTLLRQIEVEIANGKTTPQACKEAEITVQTYYRWRKEYRRPEAGSSETTEGAGAGEREAEAVGGGAVSGEADSEGRGRGKLLSPERRRCAVEHAREKYEVSERHACRLLGQWRRTQRYAAIHEDRRRGADAKRSLPWPVNTVATATGGSRRCCNVRAGRWAKIGCSASGVAKG